MRIKITSLGLVIAALGTAVSSMSSAPRPEFEAATVKPSQDKQRSGIRATPGRLTIESLPLRHLIAVAFKIRPSLVAGGPSWLDSALFDIQAKAGSPVGSDSMFLMLQALLEDRFQLRIHHETREGPVYALTIGKGGHRLKPVACVSFDPDHLPRPATPDEKPVNYCGRMKRGMNGSRQTIDAEGVGMADLAGPALQGLIGQLSDIVERTVIDETGLTAAYDFHLEWTPDLSTTSQSDDTSGPSIFTAVQEQLGLKLQSAKGRVEFLVVDHADKPSGN